MREADWVFENVGDVAPCALTRVDGAIPTDLAGTLVRNGVGTTHAGEDHWNLFDGHGQVAAFTFENGNVQYRARHVDTPLRREEVAQGRQTKRRVFTNKPSRWSNLFDVDLGNSAYHFAFEWGAHIVAGQEQGHFLLDASTLETVRPLNLGAHTKTGRSLSPMPRRDPRTGRLVMYSVAPGLADKLTFLELDNEWRVVREHTSNVGSGGSMFHDLAFSEKLFATIQWGSLSVGKALWGATTAYDAIEFDPAKHGRLLLVDRESGATRIVRVPGYLIFHIFNAFDDNDDFVADVVGYAERLAFTTPFPESYRAKHGITATETPAPIAVRLRVAAGAGEASIERLEGIVVEAPSINPNYYGKRHRYGYASARTERGDEVDGNAFFWFHGIAKIDFETMTHATWNAGPHVFCTQPVFAPRTRAASEDDGYVIVGLHDGRDKTHSLAIFDAQQLSAGPRARVYTEKPLGFASHARFEPASA